MEINLEFSNEINCSSRGMLPLQQCWVLLWERLLCVDLLLLPTVLMLTLRILKLGEVNVLSKLHRCGHSITSNMSQTGTKFALSNQWYKYLNVLKCQQWCDIRRLRLCVCSMSWVVLLFMYRFKDNGYSSVYIVRSKIVDIFVEA